MSGSFFDTFLDFQIQGTVLASHNSTQWGEASSNRILDSGNSQSIKNGIWSINSSSSVSFDICYDFSQNGIISKDFSNILAIQIDVMTGSHFLQLVLQDINGNEGNLTE